MAKTIKAPPSNKDVEDRILGVLLIEQNSVHTYIAKITSEFFYQTKNQLIFNEGRGLLISSADFMHGQDKLAFR